jgi:TolA-binding protein
MGAAATLFIMSIAKRIGCSTVLQDIGMAEKFDPEIAQAGLCKMAYGGEKEQEVKYQGKAEGLKRTDSYKSCMSCQDATQAYRDILQDVYQPICDRIACPSAPTVQKYILDKRGSAKKITTNIKNLKVDDKPDTKRQDWIIKEWGVKGDVYSGSGCGFKDLVSTSYTVSKAEPKPVESLPTEEEKEAKQEAPQEEMAQTGTPTEPAASESGVSVQGAESNIPDLNFVTGAVPMDVVGAFATGSAVASANAKDNKPAVNAGSGSTGTKLHPNKICGIDIGKAPLNSASGTVGIKDIYEIYKGDYKELKEKCTKPSFHPACPFCCGIDYMWEWNSACGVGNFLGITNAGLDIDTYDELKHSTKLAAEKVGRGDDVGGDGLLGIFNSLSGFCTPEGNPTPDVVSTHLNFNPKIQEAEENLMQVFVFPNAARIDSGDDFKYLVYRGYLAKKFVIENAVKEKGKKYDLYSFSSTLSAVKEKDLTKYFEHLGTDKEAADKKAFAAELCKPLGNSKFTGSKSCSARAPEVFEKVKAHISTVDEEYIIRPDSSIINSVRCICLSSLIAFLEQWRQIAQAIKNCIDTIILTGDGEEGMCRSMLSNYVCDLLWEIITCFANKWSKPTGTRVDAGVGVGDILGIVTGAGTDVSNQVEGRYGETAMFNAMFNEKEIVHGLCYLAFGLEWNLDVSAMVQQSVESVPVETMVLGPAPAQARFIAWNPVTNPRGLTTWEYHFGLMISAGADINTRVKLKCSTGFGCSEADGFVGGECDCNKLGSEKIISINPTCKPAWKSRLSKNELASYDCSYTVQAGKYRYDTIIFEYDWQDPGTKERRSGTSEAAINRIGSSPPVFCKFDLFSLSYRCQFGESPSGIKIEAVDPLYKFTKDNKEVFAMDEDLEFELSMVQVMPDVAEEMEQGIKYLGYKVLNSENKVVKELDPSTGEFQQHYQFKTDGAYKQKVEIRRGDQPSWENSFAAGKGTAGSRYKIEPITNAVAVTNLIKDDTTKYIDGVSIKATKDGTSVLPDPGKRFFVDIKDNAIGMYLAEGLETQAGTGLFITTKENSLGEKKPAQAGSKYTFKHVDTDRGISYEISFRLKTTDFGSATDVQFLIQYTAGQAVGDPCASKNPVTWKVTFTSYDADKYGRVTDQKSVNPQTGEVQEKTIPIQVVCAEAKDLKKKEAPEEEVAETAEYPEMQEAYKLRGEKKYTEAFNKFTDAAQKYAGTEMGIRAEFEAGATLFMARDDTRALNILDLFVKEHPQDWNADNALWMMASIYFSMNQPKEGLKVYQRILKDYPSGDMAEIVQLELVLACEKHKTECTELKITPTPIEKLPIPGELQEACAAFKQFLAETNVTYFEVAESHRELFGDIENLKSICGIAADVDIKFECDVTKSCGDYFNEKDCKEDVCKLNCEWKDKTCKIITGAKGIHDAELKIDEIHGNWRVDYVMQFKTEDPDVTTEFCKSVNKKEECKTINLLQGFQKSYDANTQINKYQFSVSLDEPYNAPHEAFVKFKTKQGEFETSPIRVETVSKPKPSIEITSVIVQRKNGAGVLPIQGDARKPKDSFYVAPAGLGVNVFLKLSSEPGTPEEVQELCTRLKMTPVQGIWPSKEVKMVPAGIHGATCRTDSRLVLDSRRFFKNKKFTLTFSLFDTPELEITTKQVYFYPTVAESHDILLNDGSWDNDYEFQFTDGEWMWSEEDGDTLYLLNDWKTGQTSSWWDAFFEGLQKEKYDYMEGMDWLAAGANDKGPGNFYSPSITIKRRGVSGDKEYADVTDYLQFYLDGYI